MKRLALFLLTFCLTGCVHVSTSSSINREINTTYGYILVLVSLSDIGSRQIVENEIVEKLMDKKIIAKASYKFLFLGKPYTNDQINQMAKDAGFDSVLFVKFTAAYTTQTYVPKTQTTRGEVTSNGYGGLDYSSKTYETGGYYLSQPNYGISTNLYDLDKGDLAWVSTSEAHGCAICSFDRVMDAFSGNMVEKLFDDGMIYVPGLPK